MKKVHILALTALCLILLSTTAWAATTDLIRVGVLRDTGSVTVTAFDGFDVIDLQTGEEIASGVKTFTAQPGYMGVRLETGQEYYRILLRPKQASGIRVNNLQVGSRFYCGTIEVRRSVSGKLTVINELNADEYVRGVVPREMPASFEKEALKAQAVIARTYALANRGKHTSEGFDVCATTHCQVYGGVNDETTVTNQAVDATLGQVLTYSGRLINAVFHASSGGHTENNENVWFTATSSWKEPYLRGVPDYDQNYKYGKWQKTYTKAEITQMLAQRNLNIGQFQGIDVTERGVSGMIRLATIQGSQGSKQVTGEQFRSYFGLLSANVEIDGSKVEEEIITEEIKTTHEIDKNTTVTVVGAQGKKIKQPLRYLAMLGFGNRVHSISASSVKAYPKIETVQKTDTVIVDDSNVVTFNGKGYGHGVGLSQWGAQGMATQGYNYEAILKHYYTGVKLENR